MRTAYGVVKFKTRQNIRSMNWLLILLTAVSISARQSTPQNQDSDPEFSIAISTPQQTIKTTSDIVVEISLTNRSGRTIRIWWPDNGLARDEEYKIMVLNEAGKVPPRTWAGRNVIDQLGVIVGSPHLANRDVKDGEVLKQRLQIARFFEFQPGKYTIQLQKGDGERAVKSNTISLTMIP
jgi:hypothetical protein